jgi:glycosyltransferase involved in cell wall biosynthesis
MHVAHFIQRYPPALGGSEAYLARLGQYLERCGDIVTVWTTTAMALEEFWQRTKGPRTSIRGLIRRYQPLVFPGRRYVLKGLSLLPIRPWQCLTMPCNPICLGMWVDAGRYDGPLDAVHAAAFPYAFPILCGLRLARRRKVPFFLTPFLHLGDPDNPNDATRKQYTTPQLRWLLKQADRVFVQTELEFAAVRDLGVKEDCIILQGLGVDPAECTGGDRERARQEWGIAPNEVVIGHLANASVEKGTVDLLRAAERAWADGRVFRVVLAGPEMPNFREFWAGFPHRDRVVRLGVLSDSQKRDFFAGIDVFALPSRSDSFGLVLLEAWANGKPNVVYRAGGPAELVRHGVDGLQAECGNVEDLARHLGLLTPSSKESEASASLARRADERRYQLGEAGRARLAAEFRWEDKLERVREAIAESISSPSEPRIQSHRSAAAHK